MKLIKHIILCLNVVANILHSSVMNSRAGLFADGVHVVVDPAHLTGWESCAWESSLGPGRLFQHNFKYNIGSLSWVIISGLLFYSPLFPKNEPIILFKLPIIPSFCIPQVQNGPQSGHACTMLASTRYMDTD